MKGKNIVKRILIYTFSAIVSLFFLWYILYHIFNGFQSKVQTLPAEISTKQSKVSLDGYLVRDEEVLFAHTEGGVNYLYSDGEKVRADSVVANIYTGDAAQKLTDKIISIDKKIEVLENSGLLQSTTVTDTNTVDSKINRLFYTLREKLENGDVEYAIYKKDELLTLLNKRQVITQSVSGYEDQIKALDEEKGTLELQLESVAEQIVVPGSGYFYTSADGYEEVFTVEKLKDMTVDSYDEMINSLPKDYSSSLNIGKTVKSNVWYVAAEITQNELKNFNEGYEYRVKFPYNADIEIDMQLDRVVKNTSAEDDRAVLIFKTGQMPTGFNFLRKQTIEIIKETYTGYKVPASAVRIHDGKKGVFILSGNIVVFKEINVLTEQDGYYIVKEQPMYAEDENYYNKLGLYELIITSGKNLYPGKIVSNAG